MPPPMQTTMPPPAPNAPPTDADLLRRYTAGGDRTALDALVRRYVDFVYATARRELTGPDAHAVDDVTQAAFLLLARKAESVPPGRVGGWLFRTTRFCCANARKLAARRRRHERRAALARPEHAMPTHAASSGAAADDPHSLVPLLNDAIDRLGAADREAVVLRYLRGHDVQAVAAALNVTHHAARKRLDRAVAKLRRALADRGVSTATVPTVTAALSLASGDAAPAATVAAVTAALTAGAAPAAAALTKGVAAMLLWTKAKAAAAALAIAAVVTTAGVEVARRAAAAQAPATTAPTTATAAATQPAEVERLLALDGMADRLLDLDTGRLLPLPATAILNRAELQNLNAVCEQTGGDLYASRAAGGTAAVRADPSAPPPPPAPDAPAPAPADARPPAAPVPFRSRAGGVGHYTVLGPTPDGQHVRVRYRFDPARAFVGTLADGVRVQLTAVGSADGLAWWTPDGTARPPVRLPPDAARDPGVPITHRLDLSVDTGRTPMPLATRLRVGGERGGRHAFDPADPNRSLPAFRHADPAAARTTVRQELSGARWEVAARLRLPALAAGGVDASGPEPVTFGPLRAEADGSAAVDVSTAYAADHTAAVAIDRDGREHRGAPADPAPDGPGRRMDVRGHRFAGLPPDRVAEVQFRRSPFDRWVEFRDVALRPGERTDVKVVTSDDVIRPEDVVGR